MPREMHEDVAFVLHRHAWKESSFILRVLTRSRGRQSVVARSMRGSRTQSPVLPGQPSQLQWKAGRELGTLVSLAPLAPQRAMPVGENWWASQYLTELVLHATREGEPVPDVFDQYLSSLDHLRDPAMDAAVVLRQFEYGLLVDLGLGFELTCDKDGKSLDPSQQYGLLPEQGLAALPRGGIPAQDWVALGAGTLDAGAARRLRQPLQHHLALLVDFGKLRSREQWQAARKLREQHQQDAAGD